MGRIVIRLKLEGGGNSKKEDENDMAQAQRFHSTQASENSQTKPGEVQITTEKVRWGRVSGRLCKLGSV